MSEVKDLVNPVVSLIKELNGQIKDGEINPDTLVKLSTTMKLTSVKLDKYVKENKMKLTAGFIPVEVDKDQEE